MWYYQPLQVRTILIFWVIIKSWDFFKTSVADYNYWEECKWSLKDIWDPFQNQKYVSICIKVQLLTNLINKNCYGFGFPTHFEEVNMANLVILMDMNHQEIYWDLNKCFSWGIKSKMSHIETLETELLTISQKRSEYNIYVSLKPNKNNFSVRVCCLLSIIKQSSYM